MTRYTPKDLKRRRLWKQVEWGDVFMRCVLFILIITMVITFAFLIKITFHETPIDKGLICQYHGFYDYDEESDNCREFFKGHSQKYDEVKDHQHWGRHCNIISRCVDLREKYG